MEAYPKTVLMIDSNPQAVETVRAHLRTLPAHLIAIRSGQEGIAFMARQFVDLCILEGRPVGMCGLEV